jgi:hypothetical protein
MNARRVILGGVVAAVAVFVIAGYLPGLVLGSELQGYASSGDGDYLDLRSSVYHPNG